MFALGHVDNSWRVMSDVSSDENRNVLHGLKDGSESGTTSQHDLNCSSWWRLGLLAAPDRCRDLTQESALKRFPVE